MFDYQKEIENIVKWMKKYNREAGTNGYVVGTSGGIDSAIMLCIAIKAVGKENVIAVSMDCEEYEYKDSMDSINLCTNLGIPLRSIPIIKPFENITDLVEINLISSNDKNKSLSKLTKGNLKSRIRADILMTFCNHNNMLLAGTSNKSEMMLGYFTVGGDGLAAMEALGEFYKHEIYEMAKHLPEIPENIISKNPTADLWEGQNDSDELGMDYKEIDKILIALEIEWATGDLSVFNTLQKDQVEKIRNMIEKSEYKRHMPPTYKRKI